MQFIRWSLFDSAEDNNPRAYSGTWDEFWNVLYNTYEPPATGKLAGQKKGMPAVSGTIFRENTRRGTENAETLHAILFDFDNAAEKPSGEFWDEGKTRPKMVKVPSDVIADPKEVCDLLRKQGTAFLAYTTWSSTPEWVKFRLVVPLKSALTPEVWPAAVEKAIADLGLEPWRKSIDMKVVRDTARLHFLPNKGAEFWGNQGGEFLFIDSEQLDRNTVPPLPKNNYARPATEEKDWAKFKIDIPSLQLGELLERLGCNLSRPRSLDDGGTKRRTTCPWGREHSHGPEGDDAVVLETPGKWPVFQCAHSGHAHLGLYDLLELAVQQGIDLFDYAKKFSQDLEERIALLDEDVTDEVLNEVMAGIAKLPALRSEQLLKKIKEKTGASLATLRGILTKLSRPKAEAGQTLDVGRRIAETMLDRYFAGGRNLLQALDKSWWSYTGTHWRRMANDNALKNYLLETIKDMPPEDQAESYLLESAFKILSALQASEQDHLRLEGIQPRVVNCRNGELWIEDDGTVELRPHRAESYLSYVLDQDYNPSAKCPLFEKAVADTFSTAPDAEDMVRNFQEIFGYVIQPRRDHKIWVICYGSGNNGKTKLIETLQHLMSFNSVYATRVGEVDKNDHSRAHLAGKLLLLDDDVETNTVLPDGLLKKLSEDKLLSGRHLYHGHFEFRATVVPVLLCNNFPSCRDLSQATQNRIMSIPFGRVFNVKTEKNPYPGIWKSEMSGVLNWAIAGYQRLMARGHFVEPESCLTGKKKFLAAANALVEYVNDGCDKETTAWMPMIEFYRSFVAWCGIEGHKYVPKKSDVERDLRSLGYATEIDSHLKQRIVRGIKSISLQENAAI